MDGNIEVQRRAHGDRREVGGAVTSDLHVVHVREVGDFLQRRDAAAVNHGHAQVIDQLLADQELGIPDAC